MTDRYDEQKLLDYLEGDLPEAEAHALKLAMLKDAQLRDLVERLQADRAALRAMPMEDPPADLMDRVHEQLERKMLLGGGADELERISGERRLRFTRIGSYLALAAMLIIGVGLLYQAMIDLTSHDLEGGRGGLVALHDAQRAAEEESLAAPPAPAPSSQEPQPMTATAKLKREVETAERLALGESNNDIGLNRADAMMDSFDATDRNLQKQAEAQAPRARGVDSRRMAVAPALSEARKESVGGDGASAFGDVDENRPTEADDDSAFAMSGERLALRAAEQVTQTTTRDEPEMESLGRDIAVAGMELAEKKVDDVAAAAKPAAEAVDALAATRSPGMKLPPGMDASAAMRAALAPAPVVVTEAPADAPQTAREAAAAPPPGRYVSLAIETDNVDRSVGDIAVWASQHEVKLDLPPRGPDDGAEARVQLTVRLTPQQFVDLAARIAAGDFHAARYTRLRTAAMQKGLTRRFDRDGYRGRESWSPLDEWAKDENRDARFEVDEDGLMTVPIVITSRAAR